jgi:hemoglobin
MSGRYHGQPMQAYFPLSIEPQHFDRAVIVRADHDRRLLAAAAVFLQKARRIADSFEIAMATQRGQIARPRHSGPP